MKITQKKFDKFVSLLEKENKKQAEKCREFGLEPICFKARLTDENSIEFYDETEEYCINYDSVLGELMCEHDCEYDGESTTTKTLNKIVKSAFGKDAYIEWEDGVVMTVCL